MQVPNHTRSQYVTEVQSRPIGKDWAHRVSAGVSIVSGRLRSLTCCKDRREKRIGLMVAAISLSPANGWAIRVGWAAAADMKPGFSLAVLYILHIPPPPSAAFLM